MSIIRLEKLLKSNAGGDLKNIIQTAQKLDDLTTRLRSRLKADAAPHLLGANVREDGELVLICSSSAWASRLRFESDALLRTARDFGVAARTCQVRVATKTQHDPE
jgi:hypothetical protein